MKIGVFFRGGNPPPWERDWAQYYEDTLQQVKLAEDVGFDGVTTTEHHFSPDGYFPSPLIFEAAMAARTERVDIASYLILLPFYQPLRFAEDAAMVDVLSGGTPDPRSRRRLPLARVRGLRRAARAVRRGDG